MNLLLHLNLLIVITLVADLKHSSNISVTLSALRVVLSSKLSSYHLELHRHISTKMTKMLSESIVTSWEAWWSIMHACWEGIKYNTFIWGSYMGQVEWFGGEDSSFWWGKAFDKVMIWYSFTISKLINSLLEYSYGNVRDAYLWLPRVLDLMVELELSEIPYNFYFLWIARIPFQFRIDSNLYIQLVSIVFEMLRIIHIISFKYGLEML